MPGHSPNASAPVSSLEALNADLSAFSLQHFFVNLQGTSFWPVFFLTYTSGWRSFGIQLVCVLFIFSLYALRLTDFWFHFAAKSKASNQRKIWIIAELTTKVDMLEYRKRVCAEFAFHFMAEMLSLLAFIIIEAPICAAYNSKLYFLCHLHTGSRSRAVIFALIAIASLLSAFALSLFLLYKYARQSLHTLFSPWIQFLSTHFWLVVVLAASSLVHPYQFALDVNHMVHLP